MTVHPLPRHRFPGLVSLALALGACGGGGGDGAAPQAAAPAVIDAGNAATITREVLTAGLGAASFGAVVGGGTLLAADGGTNVLALSMAGQRKTIQQAAPSVVIPAESFDCLVSGTVRLSGSLASLDTLTPGDRIDATFSDCDDADSAVYDGGLRIDVARFSGDILSEQFLLGASVTLSGLSISDGGATVTGNGAFDLDLDLTTPLRSDLTVSGALLEVGAGTDAWVLRDFAVTVLEDASGTSVLTQYSGTGTLEGAGFEGAVDFVTVVPLVAAGDDYPSGGELLIEGAAGATIRATVLDAGTIRLAIDLDGNNTVDETQDLPWSAVGGPGGAGP